VRENKDTSRRACARNIIIQRTSRAARDRRNKYIDKTGGERRNKDTRRAAATAATNSKKKERRESERKVS
jgi:hypothetical protein